MATLVRMMINPNFYNKLPTPLATIASLGLLGYFIHTNKNILFRPLQNWIENIRLDEKEYKLIMPNGHPFHEEVLQYIYYKYSDEINEFNYTSNKLAHHNEWKYRRKEKPMDIKIMKPNECKMTITYKDHPLSFDFKMLKDNNGDYMKLLSANGCTCSEDIICILELKSYDKELLTDFADEAKEWSDKQQKTLRACNKETMNVYYYKKDYWTLLSKSPKRSPSTVYLKEGQQEELMASVNKFFSKDTRDIYLSFGIPYKCVNLIHGPPGTGKTSIIKSVASALDCDLYILPISKDMLDTHLVDAFSYINDNEEKERIIVIEDIDTLFDETRKKGDNSNGITLQAFLNCLDGFTCVEGTMLFLTANKPEVLDYAMIRSCRIDYKMKLDYANEYQTKKMFKTFLPDQEDKFKDLYKGIKHKEYTTAMLQEFLFYNRDCENILDIIDKFNEIVEQNDPKNFEILKDVNKNFYS
jgi:hypothetical protein